jgi:hypothetical protein
MNRRQFMGVAAGSAGLAGIPAAAAGPNNAILELRHYRLRTGSQVDRTSKFLNDYLVPAMKRAGMGPIGCFSPSIGPHSPSVLVLISYPSLTGVGAAREHLAADREYQRGFEEYNSMSELPYIRVDSSLLRAFDSMPRVEVPAPLPGNKTRVFELRTYEANNSVASRRKVKMFDEGETKIFKRLGMLPVFFGETIVGPDMPNLTYMLSFDDLASRDALWGKFGSDPEWKKMRAQPGLSDPEVVSNISNSILHPLPASMIR